MVVLTALALLLAACQGLPDGTLEQAPPHATDRPALHRATGERLPAFSGMDPARRGWAQVDDLLWIERRHVPAYRAGFVPQGDGIVSRHQPLPRGTPATRGYRLRTSHVALHTNTSWAQAEVIAREAEAHVERFLRAYGDALDLRLPQGPLKVVITATRAEFERTLAGLVQDPVGWGAFYDARTGNVHVSFEPAGRGALPWQTDLRHELTHQILDLSRSPSQRGRAFAPPWFWLWEGIAMHAESLGGVVTNARATRFARRQLRGEITPLVDLVRLDPWTFEGRHYDQTASVVGFLLDPSRPQLRAATLGLVRDLLRGRVERDALRGRTGMDLARLEAAWRASLPQGAGTRPR